MMTDTVLRDQGMRVLSENLGLVEAERFISLIIREPFDYTEWQKNLYDTMSAEELFQKASDLWNAKEAS
jgi:hypothetical protein